MNTEDQSRSDFEAFFRQSRAEKRPDRVASMFDRMDGGDYVQDHTQRHWWTWQNAIKAGRFTSGASVIPAGGLAEEATSSARFARLYGISTCLHPKANASQSQTTWQLQHYCPDCKQSWVTYPATPQQEQPR